MSVVSISGTPVGNPAQGIITYLEKHAATVLRYDFGDHGNSVVLTGPEVTRTRIIRSRIGNLERDWFVRQAAVASPLWHAVPEHATLVEADPDSDNPLYSDALALFTHFMTKRRGVSLAKVSKVLHFKRPHLYPILDSHITNLYRQHAATAASRYPKLGYRRSYWMAIRDDLINPENVEAFRQIRQQLANHHDPAIRRGAGLGDLRLLDILAWQLKPTSGAARGQNRVRRGIASLSR